MTALREIIALFCKDKGAKPKGRFPLGGERWAFSGKKTQREKASLAWALPIHCGQAEYQKEKNNQQQQPPSWGLWAAQTSVQVPVLLKRKCFQMLCEASKCSFSITAKQRRNWADPLWLKGVWSRGYCFGWFGCFGWLGCFGWFDCFACFGWFGRQNSQTLAVLAGLAALAAFAALSVFTVFTLGLI